MSSHDKTTAINERLLAVAQASAQAVSWLGKRPGSAQKIPPTLYHFTDAVALLSIIEKHKFWLS